MAFEPQTPPILAIDVPRPYGVPEDWLVYNATRPLYGSPWPEGGKVAEWVGDWFRGTLYAAVDPQDEYAAQWDKRNRENDARYLVYVTGAQVEAAAMRWVATEYPPEEVARFPVADIVQSFILRLQRESLALWDRFKEEAPDAARA